MEDDDDLTLSSEAMSALRELALQAGANVTTDDDVIDSIKDLYTDIDRDDIFVYNFEDADYNLNLELGGVKQELGQTLDSTGLTIWRAAEHLSQFIFHNRAIFAGKTVVELGAGLGLCSILPSKLSVASSVVVTDGDEPTIDLLKENCIRNEDTSSIIRKLYWGDHQAFMDEFPQGFDIVLGADIIYEAAAVLPLFQTARAILEPKEDNGGMFYLSFARRNVSILKVFAIAEAQGFEHAAITDEESPIQSHPEEPVYKFWLRSERR